MNTTSKRWLLILFLLSGTPFCASGASLKEWLLKLFGIDRAPYEQFATVRSESEIIAPTGTSLEFLNIASGKRSVLWRSVDLRSPFALHDGHIAVLRSAPAGKASSEDGVWLLDRSGEKKRLAVSASRLVEILGEDPNGKLVVAQAVGGGGKFQLQLADLNEGKLHDPVGVEKTIDTRAELASLPLSGRIRNGRLLALTERGGLKMARLVDNPGRVFELLGPAEWPVQVIGAAWAGNDTVVFVAKEKPDDQ